MLEAQGAPRQNRCLDWRIFVTQNNKTHSSAIQRNNAERIRRTCTSVGAIPILAQGRHRATSLGDPATTSLQHFDALYYSGVQNLQQGLRMYAPARGRTRGCIFRNDSVLAVVETIQAS